MARVTGLILLLLMIAVALPAAAAPRPRDMRMPHVAQPGASNPDFMGMVIRDPWYDFDTNPAFPGEANRAFQDTMGATLAHIGVRWVRFDFHIVVPLADVTVDQTQAIDAEIAKND